MSLLEGTPLAPGEEVFATDAAGRATLICKGRRAGSARLWLITEDDRREERLPVLQATATGRYDNADHFGFWPTANTFNVRVLPNDWHILEVEPGAVNYDYLYHRSLKFFELLYPFMRLNVFSLASECKFETYARLMYQMCDPKNRDKTYYMPSTRDMTLAQAKLLFTYMGNVAEMQADAFDAGTVHGAVITKQEMPDVSPHERLVALLKDAVALEMALMLQYLYTGYSIPNYKTGSELVRRGQWTPEQLLLVCGDGQERPRQGWRGIILEIAHEEMVHFQVVTNLLMAIGEPFYVPDIAWPTAGARYGLGADFGTLLWKGSHLPRSLALYASNSRRPSCEGES